MASACSGWSSPSSALTWAAHCLMRTTARINGGGRHQPLTGKFCSARWVWAPQSADSGISTGPRLSTSVRIPPFGFVGLPESAVWLLRGRDLVGVLLMADSLMAGYGYTTR